ncbi:MAG: T9SS type A sorting domain-containing protein [Bacteroidota bacterium]
MKKFIFFSVLLTICSTLSLGQNVGVKPFPFQTFQSNASKNLQEYLNENVGSNTKVSIWSDNFADTAKWVIHKNPETIGNWAIISDTAAASSAWKNFWGADNMNSPTANQGVAYFDGIYQFVNNITGPENSMIITKDFIDLSNQSAVSIKFYQWYYSFNSDSTLVEISTDSINWHSYMANPDVTANGNANQWRYGWKEINISQWAANQSKVWIRFRFNAPELSGTPLSTDYGGGYGWMIDDVSLYRPPDNWIQINSVTLYDGYMQIPSGIGRPMYYDADIVNMGAIAQTHLKLHGIEITTNAESNSIDTCLQPGESFNNLTTDNYFFTPPSTIGTYKVAAFISSDSIPFLLAQDTFDIKVVCDSCMYTRDHNTYTGSRWAGASGTFSNPYTAVNKFQLNQDRSIYGINCVVNTTSKIGSKIKAVLYKYSRETATIIIVAQSTNYFLEETDIPASPPLLNPPSISLPFPSGYILQKDSIYYLGIQTFGGIDTVKIATDNTSIPQPEQASLFYDPAENIWYTWGGGNAPAMMIRGIFNQNMNWNMGIIENKNIPSQLVCMPNPAKNKCRITYTLTNNDKASIIITDMMGRSLRSISLGLQIKGNYTLDIDLSEFISATYFLCLKTTTSQACEKLIIIR